ncbi:MAG TPA: diguanylate cyclase [Lysobacter sp.]
MRHFLTALCLWLACFACIPASAQTLRVELLLTEDELDGPPAAASVAARDNATRDRAATIPLRRRAAGYWLRLTSDRSIAVGEQRVLVLQGARALGPVTFYPPAARARKVADAEHGGSALLRRGWALPLPNGWPAASVAYLRVGGGTSQPLTLQLSGVEELARVERGEARFTSGIFTALMLMAVAMLGIWVVFRDLLYLSYGAYLVCVALYVVLMSGDAAEMWSLSALSASGYTAVWAMATLATILQLEFSVRFLELDRLLPRLGRVVRGIQLANVVLLVVLLLGRERVHGWYYLAGNLLLLASIPLLLAIAVLARLRGAAYAGYYLLGWTPLLAFVVLVAINPFGFASGQWADRGLALAAVLESGVLALALSQHAANRHRIALLARQSLERDPLTGALNGPALEQMLAAWTQLGSLGARSYGLLLLEIGDFGTINTSLGRAVGDAVLQQAQARIRGVLRPDDTIARIDADRFGIVSECPASECAQLAQRLRDAFRQRPFRVDGHDLSLDANVGLAMWQRGETVATLFERATAALARAAGVDASGLVLAPRHADGD